jgi:alpha-tubulin suppressor-like RCC1 family protein
MTTHALALRQDGTVWAWGNNMNGQLGNGTVHESLVPLQVPGLTQVVALAAKQGNSYALRRDGSVWAWGANWCGQAGADDEPIHLTPVQVPSLSGVVSISTGMYLSVAIRGDGSVWYWGCPEDYEMPSRAPRQVPGMTDILKVSEDRFGLTAVRSDGTVWQYFPRQLETGTPAQPVAGFTGVVDVASSFDSIQVLRSNGTVWNLGDNHAGERGFPSERLTPPGPSRVPGLTGVVSLASAPFSHTIHALRGDGTAVGWGSNESSMLGSGFSSLHLEPARVWLPCRLKVAGAGHEDSSALWPCAPEH